MEETRKMRWEEDEEGVEKQGTASAGTLAREKDLAFAERQGRGG